MYLPLMFAEVMSAGAAILLCVLELEVCDVAERARSSAKGRRRLLLVGSLRRLPCSIYPARRSLTVLSQRQNPGVYPDWPRSPRHTREHVRDSCQPFCPARRTATTGAPEGGPGASVHPAVFRVERLFALRSPDPRWKLNMAQYRAMLQIERCTGSKSMNL